MRGPLILRHMPEGIRATAKALKASQTGLQPRSAESKELKAIIAPKSTPLNAEPNSGIQTAPATLMN
jgi:hypothetical protein